MAIDRRGFLQTATAAGVAGAAGERPNILYIMTDQQHAGMMSCTGNKWLRTPHMDALAASGVRFELAYSGNPVCVPARTSMMTGRYPSHFGFGGNNAPRLPDSVLPGALGNVFRAAGYRTAFGGKTHWPKPMTAESIGFEYITRDEREGLATACVEFLKSPQERPFLLVASFINPHDICYMAIDAHSKGEGLPTALPKSVVEREYLGRAARMPAGVTREEFYGRHCPPMPANAGATAGEPAAFSRLTGFRRYVRAHWGEEEWRLHRWAYCRLTEGVDEQIGRGLGALRIEHRDLDAAIAALSSDPRHHRLKARPPALAVGPFIVYSARLSRVSPTAQRSSWPHPRNPSPLSWAHSLTGPR